MSTLNTRGKKVLICPLNWGLGHATRCVPIIYQFIELQCEVFVAADGLAYQFFQTEFPEIKLIHLQGFEIRYPNEKASKFQWFKSIIPGFAKSIKQEHLDVQEIISNFQIDIVISDNRYGVWGEETHNIFLTHQLSVISPLRFPFANTLLQYLTRQWIKEFHECWVPDFIGKPNLSGALGHTNNTFNEISYIGALSRFSISIEKDTEEKFDLLIILSGPEPQRSILENIILKQLEDIEMKTLLIRGLPGNPETLNSPSHVKVISHLPSGELKKALLNSKWVICRSGYSSIMDLVFLKKAAILIPTPGQTEQEYLAKKLADEKLFYSLSQSNFILKEALKQAFNFPDVQFPDTKEILKKSCNQAISNSTNNKKT